MSEEINIMHTRAGAWLHIPRSATEAICKWNTAKNAVTHTLRTPKAIPSRSPAFPEDPPAGRETRPSLETQGREKLRGFHGSVGTLAWLQHTCPVRDNTARRKRHGGRTQTVQRQSGESRKVVDLMALTFFRSTRVLLLSCPETGEVGAAVTFRRVLLRGATTRS